MAEVAQVGLWENAIQLYKDVADPRVANWFMMSSIINPIVVIMCYMLLCVYIVPAIAKAHPYLNVYGAIMNIYNIIMFVANLLVSIWFTWNIYKAQYSFICQPINYNGSEYDDNIANIFWFYYMIRVVELWDTLLVLLKKGGIIPHPIFIYHHASMVLITWIGAKFTPGGTSAIFAMMNSWVHVVLYVNYKLGDLEYGRKANATNITIMVQLIQFFLVIVSCIIAICADCSYPKGVAATLILYVLSFVLIVAPTLIDYIFTAKN